MQDEAKTKEQLIDELKELRQRVAENNKGASTDPAVLRRHAEEQLKARQTETDQRETNDTERLYHELETHQVELEMQNEELRNAMVQIEESRTRYSDLYDFAPVGYLTLDEHGLVLEANLTSARQLGIERSRLVGTPLSGYIVIADRNPFRSHLGNVLKDKTHQSCEIRFMKGSGGDFHALLDTIFVMDAVGERRVRTSVRDITKRKRVETALAESEQRFKLLYERTPIAYQSLDENGNFIEVNPAWLKVLGYKKEEVIGRNFADFLPPDWVNHFKENFPRFKVAGEILGVEFEMVKKDGSAIQVSFHGKIGRDSLGRFKQTHCIFHDITEERRTEERLRGSEQRFRSLFEHNRAVMLLIEPDSGTILDANEAAVEFYGFSRTELCDMNIVQINQLPGEAVAEARQSIMERKTNSFVFPHRLRSGEVRTVEVYASPIEMEGRIVLYSIVHDITERAKQAKEIEHMNRLYSVLSRVSQAVVRATSTEKFLEQACREIVEGGGFLQAWIGRVESMTDAVVPTAFWGRIGEYVQGITVYADSRPEGLGPTGTCIRKHHTVVYNDFLHGPQTLPWRDRAAPFGIASAAAFPIERAGGVWGALTIYSDEVDRFGDEDVKLLEKVAGDIGFALENLDREFRRKRAEEALRKSEQQFRTLVKNAPEAIFIQVAGRFAYLNDAAIRLYGAASEKELLGHAIVERIHPDNRAKILERIRLINEEGKPASLMEQKHVNLDGTTVYVEAHSVPIRYQNSKGALVFVRDITERKKAEKALRESEERYSRLFEDASLGIFRSNPEGKLINVNPAYARMFGFDSPEEAESQVNDVADLYVNLSRRKEIVCMILDGKGPINAENQYKRKDGSIFTGNIHAWAVRDTDGKLLYYEGFVDDISERKRAEEEKEKLEAQLRQSQKVEAIGMLAGGIAHDFNNILQPIIGYTEMELLELPPSSPMRESLEQVLNASLRAKELVKQILVVSRSTEEEQRIPIDISSIIKEALKLLRSSLPTSIEVRQNIRKGLALADPTQIHQVLMNLCTNASHAMDGKGILEVRLSPVDLSESDLADQYIFDLKPGPYLRLKVSDTGCGMGAKTTERIFDPYFTTKEVGKGTGLGLAVVNGIVKRHAGAIAVRSEPGKGSTFSIFIPRLDAQPEATMQADGPLQRGSERILLVDDEPAVMEMGTSILKRLGYKVTSQTDSVKALEVFRSSPDEFDLVITDYTMPKLTGLDFAREVLRTRPDIPLLLCTGFSEKITPDSLKELGMGLLMKPYNMRQISKAVRKILDAQKGGRFGKGN